MVSVGSSEIWHATAPRGRKPPWRSCRTLPSSKTKLRSEVRALILITHRKRSRSEWCRGFPPKRSLHARGLVNLFSESRVASKAWFPAVRRNVGIGGRLGVRLWLPRQGNCRWCEISRAFSEEEGWQVQLVRDFPEGSGLIPIGSDSAANDCVCRSWSPRFLWRVCTLGFVSLASTVSLSKVSCMH